MAGVRKYADAGIATSVCRRKFLPIIIGLALGVALFRLSLSADRDILAVNAPYDDYWFVQSAGRWIWGGVYNHMALANLPIYSIWLALLDLLGVPARLGIDLAWLLGTSYAAFALVRFSSRFWIGSVFWVLCLFHPLMIGLFDHARSETLLVVLMPFVMGAALEVWTTRSASRTSWAHVAATILAVTYALAFHVRKEGVLLLLPIALLVICSLFGTTQWWTSARANSLGMRLIGWPLILAVTLGIFLASVNYLRWGVAVRYELAAPGYVRAISALNQIDAGPRLLRISVTRVARHVAYEYSPTFRELKGFFEGESGRILERYSAQFTGHPGEIGSGWFYWAVRDAGASVGWHLSAEIAEGKYGAIANELEAAFATGHIASRAAWLPSFLDPDWRKWIGFVPSSTWSTLRLVPFFDVAGLAAGVETATPLQMKEFIEVLGRRNPVAATRLAGWILLPAGAMVGLGNGGADPLLWVVLSEKRQRPDVPGALGFDLSMPGNSSVDELVVRTIDGSTGRISIDQLHVGAMGATHGKVAIMLGVDELSFGPRADRVGRWLSQLSGATGSWDWLAQLGKIYRIINVVLLAIFGAIVVICSSRKSVAQPALVACCIAGIIILSRGLLFGILDASSWDGAQARYMAPMVPVFVFMVAVAMSAVQVQYSVRAKSSV